MSLSPKYDNKTVWQSYVWHNDKCFFVSTIKRYYDTCEGMLPGQETLVWAYDYDKKERGAMLHQAKGIVDHKQICHSLIVEGDFPDEENEKTKRFCHNYLQNVT